MKLIDVLNEQPQVGFKYKWKPQPEFRGKAPSRAREETRRALGSREQSPDAGQKIKYTPPSEFRGVRPSDPRQPQSNTPPEGAPVQPSGRTDTPANNQQAAAPEQDERAAREDRLNYMNRYKFTGEKANLGQQILKFADRLGSKPAEFERLEKIVQQEANRRKTNPGLVPRERQGV